jgi:thiol-disulfide isomerase/thioredoxin
MNTSTETFVTVLAIVVIAVLVYKLWKPSLKPKSEVPPGKANFYFFYADWCGWSQKALPEWKKLEEALQKSNVFGRTQVTPARVNVEENKAKAMLYEVEGYPTVLLETSDSIYEFKGSRSSEGLLSFLRSTLGKERESV